MKHVQLIPSCLSIIYWCISSHFTAGFQFSETHVHRISRTHDGLKTEINRVISPTRRINSHSLQVSKSSVEIGKKNALSLETSKSQQKQKEKSELSHASSQISKQKQFSKKISMLGKRGKWEEARLVFDKMTEEGVEQNQFHFSSVIAACARAGKIKECQSLLQKMENMAFTPEISTYNLIMREMLKTKEWAQVLLLFYQMKHRCKPGTKDFRIAYCYALRACEHSGGWQTASQIYSELKEKDCDALEGLPAVVYFRLLAKAKQYALAYDQLDTALKEKGYVNLALANYAIIVCAKNQDCKKALDILENLMPEIGITADAFTYSAAVDACAKAGSVTSAMRVFDLAKQRGIEPSVMMVNSMLHCYHQKGDWENALALFNQMKKSTIQPDMITYSTMMYLIAMYGDASLLPPMMEQVKEAGLIPDVRALDTILCNLGKRDEGEVALELLDLMETMDIRPTAVTYSATIAANDDKHRTSVLQVYDRMKAKGFVPDNITYSMVLKALKKQGNATQICDLMREMWKEGRPINTATYNRIFSVLAKKGEPKLIRTMIEEMKVRGQEPTEGIYTSLIVSLYKAQKLSKALEELKRLRRQGKPVRAAAYTAVITACRREKAVDLALDLVDELKADPTRSPTLITYNALLSVVTSSGDMAKAEKLVKEMSKEGFQPDSITYQSLILGYSHKGKWEMILSLMDKMAESGIIAKWLSFKEAIRAAEKTGNWKGSLRYITEMREKNLKPDSAMYGSVIGNCAKVARWELALDLLNKMEEDGLAPDLSCYSSAISACEKAGEWRKALSILLKMIKHGMEPDTNAYNSALSACSTGNEWQMALKLLDSMQQTGVKLDEVSYSSAIAACYKGGQWQRALNLLIVMKDSGFAPSYTSISTVIEALENAKQYDKAVYVYNEFVVSVDKERFDPSSGRFVDLNGLSQGVAKAAVRSGLQSLLQKYINSEKKDLDVQDFTFITGIGHQSEKQFEPILRPVKQEFLLKEFDPPLATHFQPENEGRLIVYKENLLDWLQRMTTPMNGISPAEFYGNFQLRWPTDFETEVETEERKLE